MNFHDSRDLSFEQKNIFEKLQTTKKTLSDYHEWFFFSLRFLSLIIGNFLPLMIFLLLSKYINLFKYLKHQKCVYLDKEFQHLQKSRQIVYTHGFSNSVRHLAWIDSIYTTIANNHLRGLFFLDILSCNCSVHPW